MEGNRRSTRGVISPPRPSWELSLLPRQDPRGGIAEDCQQTLDRAGILLCRFSRLYAWDGLDQCRIPVEVPIGEERMEVADGSPEPAEVRKPVDALLRQPSRLNRLWSPRPECERYE